jgi:hypothetical protein
MRSIQPPKTIESADPYAWMGKRPGRRATTPTTTELRGPSAWPAKYAKRRPFPAAHEQKYRCWQAETLGNVSQWGDGPGVYNLTNPSEPKGKQVPYITDGRGGRKLFPDTRTSSLAFTGPWADQRGKPIDYFLAKNGGSMRTRMYANEDIGDRNPYLLAEAEMSADFGFEPPPAIVHPEPLPFNKRGESLSRLEFM